MTETIEHTATLVSAALAGDEAAFTRLVDSHKEAVFAIAVTRTGDFDSASDIAQEVFLRAYISLHRLQDPARFSGWLRTIAENRCRTWLARRQQQPAREVFDTTAPHLPAPESPDRDLERTERRKVVLDAIERLTPDTRETLVLHYMEGVPTPQLATLLGLSEAAVRQRLHRGREQIRDEVAHMIDEALHDEVPGDAFTAEVEKLLTRSRTRFGSVRFRDAVTDLERAVELHTDDVAMALLLVDAYTFARSPEELAEFPRDAERALAVLDQAVAATDDGHDNLVLRLKRASVQTTLAFSDKSGGQMREVLKENRTLLAEAKDSGLEPIAQMELARRCIFSGLPDEALKLYARLSKNQGWNSLVLSETGLAHAAGGDGSKAIRVFEKAIASTTPATMEALNAAFVRRWGSATGHSGRRWRPCRCASARITPGWPVCAPAVMTSSAAVLICAAPSNYWIVRRWLRCVRCWRQNSCGVSTRCSPNSVTRRN